MKKIFISAIAVSLMLGLTACNKTPEENSNSIGGIGETPIKQENPRENYTKEEAAEIINKLPNMKAAEDMVVNVPKSIDHVSTFYTTYLCETMPLTFEEQLADFKNVFEYLLPDREFKEECLSTVGGENRLRVYEHYDEFKSGQIELVFFLYSEYRSENKDPVSICARPLFGSDIAMFNRGVAQSIAKPEKDRASDWFYGAVGRFEHIGTYPPYCEERFMLLDKEVSVKEAVEFFEKYIDDIPCMVPSPYRMCVNVVDVYKVRDGLYCFDFLTSREYGGIPFNYTANGAGFCRPGDMSMGFMIESDNVDSFYGVMKAFGVHDEVQYNEIVSFEEAAKIVADNLTDYVNFSVTSTALVYCRGGRTEDGREPVFPTWEFKLYNENDGRKYFGYVDALNGEFDFYGRRP